MKGQRKKQNKNKKQNKLKTEKNKGGQKLQ